MIRFETNDNNGIDLPTDANLTITAVNPMFDSENADRSFSYPTRCAWSAHNKSVLSHAHRVDSAVDIEQVALSLLLNDIVFETGIGAIEADTDKDFELTFKSATNAALAQLDTLTINTLLDSINVPQTLFAEWSFNVPQIQSSTYALTINDQVFSVTKVSGFDQAVPMTALKAQINAVFPNIADYAGNIFTISDPTNAYPDLKMHPYTEGFEIRAGYRNHSQAKHQNFLDYLKNQFTNPSSSHRFPVIFNDAFFAVGKKPLHFTGFINYQKLSSSNVLTQGQNTPFETADMAHTYVPFVRLRYVLDKIAAAIALPIQFAFDVGPQLDTLLIWNNQTIDELGEQWFTDTFSHQYFPIDLEPKRKILNHFQTVIDLNKHVLPETAKDFLTRIGNCFESYYVIENGAIVFKKKQNSVKNDAMDWTDKRATGFTRKRKKRVGFTLDYTRDEADSVVMAATNLQKYVSGDGGNVVKVPFHTFPSKTVEGMTLPFSAQEGSTAFDGIGKRNYAFALLFDRGVQLDIDGKQYHQAHFETPELSLQFDGANGLYTTFFKDVIELLDGATYTFVLNLSAAELANLRLWQSTKRYFLTETGTVLGVVRNVQFKASRKGIEPARVEIVAYP